MDDPNGPFRHAGVNLDTYETGRGVVGQSCGCSYCGSMHPDDFMQAIRDGDTIGPTDKNYKAYVSGTLSAEIAERDSRLLERYVANGASEETARDLLAESTASSTGPSKGKFYYQHLSREQMDEFIELYNTKVMKIGYPGHFYTRPFFCQ